MTRLDGSLDGNLGGTAIHQPNDNAGAPGQQRLYGTRRELTRQHPVAQRGGAAALDTPQHTDSRLEVAGVMGKVLRDLARARMRALRRHDDIVRLAVGVGALQVLGDGFQINGALGNDGQLRAGGDGGEDGEIPGVAPP